MLSVDPDNNPIRLCPDDGSYPNPYDCHKYFVCISDNAWAFICPGKLYFNAEKKVCDTKGNAHCIPSTTLSTFPTSSEDSIIRSHPQRKLSRKFFLPSHSNTSDTHSKEYHETFRL
ncbi:hypothetical protein J437_LFUL013263 [Ladona fulva]|uniref:Chitin-binding type-2 domain-containing protein n=1 Tax=Ladona fulva TaxID=123851 RepID=A0A8K0P716_LADFU|nr:hypothetical protein J437_LFUL013263 [Ladona fulva]